MKKKSWHLNRRTFLKSASVCMALPWMEAMAADTKSIPKRFFGGYFAYGVPMPKDDAPDRMKHGWFPMGTGRNYKAPDMHKSIMPLRDKITFISGLSHPDTRNTSAHKGADWFLTGADILNSYEKQSISIDQHIANSIGDDTRFKSLVMSTFGGVNRPYRTATLSFDRSGRPIPSLHIPAEIFRRMFGKVSSSEKNALASRGSIIDEVLAESKDLERKLGKNDKEKMDEYLTSVRQVEKMTERSVKWQNTPKAKVDASKLDLSLTVADGREYLQLMYHLIFLAFQTNTTKVASFQTACEEAGISERFPEAIGLKESAHKLSHEKKDYTKVASYITFLNDMHAEFIKKLDSVQEGNGTLLDNTLSFYGCATSVTHRPVNYPIIISGGKNMGFKHGSHHNYSDDIPLSNLFVTMANQMGVPTKEFARSTGDITEVLG